MSGHFEAKKIAWRQTAKDGIVLALSIHPDDMPKEMAGSALNTRYMIAFSEIGDDEKPVGQAPQAPEGGGSPKSSKPFSSLPLSQQAGIRCSDKMFANFISSIGWHSESETAEEWVRKECLVESRSELRAGTEAGDRWLRLDTKYDSWLTDQKYAGAHR